VSEAFKIVPVEPDAVVLDESGDRTFLVGQIVPQDIYFDQRFAACNRSG